MKKIYGFYGYLWWGENTIEIKEYEVTKETEKQYKIKNGFPSTINKATMRVDDYRFYETREEAVKGLVDCCKSSVEYCEEQISNTKAKMNKYQEIIKAYEKEIKQ